MKAFKERMIQEGNTVEIAYEGRLPDGKTFANASRTQPLVFKVGAGSVLTAVEDAVRGMNPGQQCELFVPAKAGFGEHDQQDVLIVSRDSMTSPSELHEGDYVEAQRINGDKLRGRIKKFDRRQVELDCNHPLAGQDLEFTIQVLRVY